MKIITHFLHSKIQKNEVMCYSPSHYFYSIFRLLDTYIEYNYSEVFA